VEGVPTVREADGLALSSRNANLTSAQRRIAPKLASTLLHAAEALGDGTTEAEPVLSASRSGLLSEGFDSIDYLSLRDAGTLAPLDRADRPARLLAAAWLGGTRLIDNIAVP
jgi:pantoate--beta-alanine ligase